MQKTTSNFQFVTLAASVLVSVFIFLSCDDPIYTPRPRAYPKIEYPTRTYTKYDTASCNFSFEYPTYAKIVAYERDRPSEEVNDCWFDLYVPQFDCRLHCTYYALSPTNEFENLKSDAFRMANNHNLRADYIDEIPIQKANGVHGFAFKIEGPAASPFQFYLSDSTDHFLRGALYFNTQVKEDSLAPIYDFVTEDILYMISSFAWK